MKKDEKQPDLEEGIEYWTSQPASYNGVLGELHHSFGHSVP